MQPSMQLIKKPKAGMVLVALLSHLSDHDATMIYAKSMKKHNFDEKSTNKPPLRQKTRKNNQFHKRSMEHKGRGRKSKEQINQSVNPSMSHSSIRQPVHPIILRNHHTTNVIYQQAKGQDGAGRPNVPLELVARLAPQELVALLSHRSWSPYCPT